MEKGEKNNDLLIEWSFNSECTIKCRSIQTGMEANKDFLTLF